MTSNDLKSTARTFSVGQRVWVYDRNRRGSAEGRVTKVGRKLLTVVSGEYDSEDQFRIADGRVNDRYGNQWIRTDEERDRLDREAAAHVELKAAGLEVRIGYKIALPVLEAVVATLREVLGTPDAT